jgi:hypothetical protein
MTEEYEVRLKGQTAWHTLCAGLAEEAAIGFVASLNQQTGPTSVLRTVEVRRKLRSVVQTFEVRMSVKPSYAAREVAP